MNKFSIANFVSVSLTEKTSRPEHIWNFGCSCGKHETTEATVRLADVPAIATSLGFDDLVTKNDFYKKLSHAYLASKSNA